ncbi:MAG: helicase-related protein [bacterium]|nr:helicase-related protein [bacterium]
MIDEQHKFGVKQRGFFQQFGSPHILQMTATPIPRSLALAFFGEFTVSTIDELPVGRKPITTKIVSEAERHKLKPRILSKIAQQQRVFVITPLIEDSDKMDELKSAVQQFHELTGLYPELQGRIGLLHGRLKSPEKDEVMKQFKEGKLDMLVSTTVVEVGIDVPEATVMIIMNAERF